MYAKILIPIDAGGAPETVVEHAALIAKAHGADIVGLRVIPIVSSDEPFFNQIQVEEGSRGARLRAEALRHFAVMEQQFNKLGVRFSGEVTFDEKAEADVIAEYAKTTGASLIIMPTQQKSALSRWFMGNVEDKLRRRAAVPVLFVPVAGQTAK
jgi:nucleotide-binding universal stress UspA family protein